MVPQTVSPASQAPCNSSDNNAETQQSDQPPLVEDQQGQGVPENMLSMGEENDNMTKSQQLAPVPPKQGVKDDSDSIPSDLVRALQRFDEISFGTQSSEEHTIQTAMAKANDPQVLITQARQSQSKHPSQKRNPTKSDRRGHDATFNRYVEYDTSNTQQCSQRPQNAPQRESEPNDPARVGRTNEQTAQIHPQADEPAKSPNEWSTDSSHQNAGIDKNDDKQAIRSTPTPQKGNSAATAKVTHDPTFSPNENVSLVEPGPWCGHDEHAGWLQGGHEDSASADEAQQQETDEDEGALEIDDADMEISSTPHSVKT